MGASIKICYVMLCYVMLCYVMLCYVMLCYVMLCYVMLCYVMFECSNRYVTSEYRERVRISNLSTISPSIHVLFYLLYKLQNTGNRCKATADCKGGCCQGNTRRTQTG